MTRNTRRNAQNIERRPAAPKWTAEEEEIILDEIGKNPTNVKVALLAAAEKLPARTFYACSGHWYTKMANRDDVIGKLTIGRYTTVRNKTRLKPEQTDTHKKRFSKTVWDAIVGFIFRRNEND